MLDQFWYNESQVPAGSGWPLFGMVHLVSLGVVALAVLVLWKVFKRLTRPQQEVMLRVMATSVVATELIRDVILAGEGVFNVWYLPLHLCSLSMFAYLVHAFSHSERLRRGIAEVGVVLLLPGTIAALLFPNWSALPPANFVFVHSFFSHGMLAAYPLLLLWSGRVRPRISHLWWSVVTLAVLTPVIGIFDALTGCNFFFVATPQPGSPLVLIHDLMGDAWLVGYAVLVLAMMLLAYGCVTLWERRHPLPAAVGREI